MVINDEIYQYQCNKIVNELIKLYGDKSLKTSDLNKLGHLLFKNKYLGTFPVDKTPIHMNGYCVVNTDTSDKSGEHWIAIAITKKKIYIYDTFGRKTHKVLPDIYKLAKKHNKKIIESKNDIDQLINTKYCGYYCIAFLIIADTLGIENALKI